MRNRKNSGRIFVLSLLLAIIFSIAMAGLFALRNRIQHKNDEDFALKRAELNALSALNLISAELKKPMEQRWGEGWTIHGNTCLYTDSDGTGYEGSLLENGQYVLVKGRYGNKKYNIRFKTNR